MKGILSRIESKNAGIRPEGPVRPKVYGAFVFSAAVFYLILSLASSCIRPLDKNDGIKPLEPDDSTKGSAALSFFLDKASYDSCLIVREEVVRAAGYESANFLTQLDSNNYRLTVSTSSGAKVYDGNYADRPEVLYVKSGTYRIRVVSGNFEEPSFSPLFGQELSVKAKKDSTLRIAIVSRQLTSGIRFIFTEGFTSWFKGTGIYIKRDTLSFIYGYGTRIYRYIYPGEISVVYKNKNGNPSYTPPDKPNYADTVLFKRKIKADELVTITLDYDLTKVERGGFSFKADTSRVRVDEYFNLGGIAPYGCRSVWYAQTHIGDTIKLFGYIVGGDASSTTFKKSPPFSSKTNIVIGAQDWQSLREKTIGVELPNGNIRKELNLVDHPEHLKKPIVINGVVSDSYFGYPGLKNITSYTLLK